MTELTTEVSALEAAPPGPGPLFGLKVVELASEHAAWAGKLLADLGAEVTLVEPPGGHATRAMTERLRTEDGITAYRQRGHIAETPHGHIKHNMRFRQLSVRGTPRATAEWTFTVTVHNLLKAITTGHLTPQALAQLTAQPT